MLKTPIKLVDSSSLNRLSNSVNIASDMRIAVNDGYILKVKQQGVEVSGGNDPYDTEAYMKAQKMAGSLSTLLRNACGNMHTVAYSHERVSLQEYSTYSSHNPTMLAKLHHRIHSVYRETSAAELFSDVSLQSY